MSEIYPDPEAKIIPFPNRFTLPEAVTDPAAGLNLNQRAEELERNIRFPIDKSGWRYKIHSRLNKNGETAYAQSDRAGEQSFELTIELLKGGGVLVYKPWLNYKDDAIHFQVGGGKPPLVAYGRPAGDGEDTEFARSTDMDEKSFDRLVELLQNSHLIEGPKA